MAPRPSSARTFLWAILYSKSVIANARQLRIQTDPLKSEPATVTANGPWLLYPEHNVPGEVSAAYGPEVTKEMLPSDFGWDLFQKCVPGRNFSVIYNVTQPVLVPFIVKRSSANFKDATIIVAPSGGGMALTYEDDGIKAARWLNALGISAFILKYRVPRRQGTDVQLQDSQRAISLVRYHADKFGLNSSRIGWMGFSCGAFLATQVSHEPTRSYADLDAADGLSYKPDFALTLYGGGHVEVAPGTAPMFMAIAKDDPCVAADSVTEYFNKLVKIAPKSELHVFPSGGHGFGFCNTSHHPKEDEARAWPNLAKLFLEKAILGMH